jgi:hypothetical protein
MAQILVSKHGKPLFVAVPFSEELLGAGVGVAYADRLVQAGELSVSAAAKIAGMPYARYLQHLGALGYSMVDESANLADELGLLPPTTVESKTRPKANLVASSKVAGKPKKSKA